MDKATLIQKLELLGADDTILSEVRRHHATYAPGIYASIPDTSLALAKLKWVAEKLKLPIPATPIYDVHTFRNCYSWETIERALNEVGKPKPVSGEDFYSEMQHKPRKITRRKPAKKVAKRTARAKGKKIVAKSTRKPSKAKKSAKKMTRVAKRTAKSPRKRKTSRKAARR